MDMPSFYKQKGKNMYSTDNPEETQALKIVFKDLENSIIDYIDTGLLKQREYTDYRSREIEKHHSYYDSSIQGIIDRLNNLNPPKEETKEEESDNREMEFDINIKFILEEKKTSLYSISNGIKSLTYIMGNHSGSSAYVCKSICEDERQLDKQENAFFLEKFAKDLIHTIIQIVIDKTGIPIDTKDSFLYKIKNRGEE